jgi:hypothetical protein
MSKRTEQSRKLGPLAKRHSDVRTSSIFVERRARSRADHDHLRAPAPADTQPTVFGLAQRQLERSAGSGEN